MKFKPLLPSLKEKKRYLIFEIIGIKCSLEKIKIVILLNLHDFVGEYGLGLMGIIFLDDWQNNRGIIRVNNKYVDLLKASFVKIDKIDNFEFIRTVAIARIMMPTSMVRLSAGRVAMSEEMQTLCFMILGL